MEKDKDLKRLMEDLGFCFDTSKNCWYYKGNLIIPNDFRPCNIMPNVNISIDGCLTINGSCYVGNINATKLIVTGPLSCDDLDVFVLDLKDNLHSKSIKVVHYMLVQKNVDAFDITVDGTMTVLGKTTALSIRASHYCLRGGVDCTSIRNNMISNI